MNTFYKLLCVTLVAVTTNNLVWFGLTYWAYLTTKSVISTSVVAGIWLVTTAASSNWFGSIIDHHKKKTAMLASSLGSLLFFSLGLLLISIVSAENFTTVMSLWFWLFAVVLLFGVITGAMYSIAIPTLVAFLVPEKQRDRANGLFGTVIGISFAITSVGSGVSLAFGGMSFILLLAIILTLIVIILLLCIAVPEEVPHHAKEGHKKNLDLTGTVRAVRAVPGLLTLILFTTFNNFLGGVFMSLMDAYGLTLVSVQVWGTLWGILSTSFILGGLYIAKKGLGVNPLRNLFRINIVTWTVCIFFTVQPSIILLTVGILIWMFFVPFIEATEQTIFQKVVPKERLGRVFGFAHSVEQAASPVTAFMIGPIAQLVFIPFMTTGQGVELIGSWFGVGVGRGIALVFIFAGIIGLLVTIIAMHSGPYKLLAARYQQKD